MHGNTPGTLARDGAYDSVEITLTTSEASCHGDGHALQMIMYVCDAELELVHYGDAMVGNTIMWIP